MRACYGSAMADLLLEIGVEELPVSFVTMGLSSLESLAGDVLAKARLEPKSLQVLGTPRRLSLLVRGLPAAQPARSETVTGPPWAAAFRDGEATKAASGFAKKYGARVDALQKVSTDKGDYVAVEVHEAGRAAAEVLAGLRLRERRLLGAWPSAPRAPILAVPPLEFPFRSKFLLA